MLIRPIDRTIFNPTVATYRGRPRLRFLVLDEAHVYAGSQAAEIHMLLRRAAERFGTSIESVQGFATSATLPAGPDTSAPSPILALGASMFAKNENEVAVVTGRRHLPALPPPAPERRPIVPAPGASVPAALRTLELDDEGHVVSLVQDRELCETAIAACSALDLVLPEAVATLSEEARRTPAIALYELLAPNPRLRDVRELLFQRDTSLATIDEVAVLLFGEGEPSEMRRAHAAAVLALAALARSSASALPLIPTRTHVFVTAPVGAWTRPPLCVDAADGWLWGDVSSMPPGPESDGIDMLELFVCADCGCPAVKIWLDRDPEWGTEELSGKETGTATPALAWRGFGGSTPLPVSWGRAPVRTAPVGRHDGDYEAECPSCGRKDARYRPVRFGPRAALGAIIDAVYPFLGAHASSRTSDHNMLPGQGRRLLTFSDSRQEAARVASRVEETHDVGLNRQILWRIISREGPIPMKDLLAFIENAPLLDERAVAAEVGPEAREDLATLCVYQEFARPPARGRTLETLGLVEVVYPNLPGTPSELSGRIDDSEWRDFLSTVLDDARRRGAVRAAQFSTTALDRGLHELLPPTIDKRFVLTNDLDVSTEADEDEFVEPRGTDGRIPLIPGPEHLRARSRLLAYARRVAGKVSGVSDLHLLDAAWRALVELSTTSKWLRRVETASATDIELRLDLRYLELRPHASPPFFDAVTGRAHYRAVRDVSPDLHENGLLHRPSAAELEAWRNSNAVRRVMDTPLGLWSVEHTAQLDVEELEDQERDFRAGRRNLMASSTTLELGVDIGGLSLVILTNVPPSPANYWQRAGRAGRRTDGSSMVITLASSRPHDQRAFRDPKAFLGSPIPAPFVRLDLEPLIRRQVHASLLGAFFDDVVQSADRGNPMRAFGTIEEFVFNAANAAGSLRPEAVERLGVKGEEALCDIFVRWTSLLAADGGHARRLARLTRGTALEAEPPERLAEACAARLRGVVDAIRHDRAVIEEQRRFEEGKGEGAMDERFLQALGYQERALLSDTVIASLARGDFLPRFGFPLDIVHLDTRWQLPQRGRREQGATSSSASNEWPELRMERALDIALSEYAPGGEVLAHKRVFTVAGIVRNWLSEEEAVRRRYFFECIRCGHAEDRDVPPRVCPLCQHPTIETERFLEEAHVVQKQHRRRRAQSPQGPIDDASAVREYLQPAAFAVKLGVRPRRFVRRELVRMPGARVTIAAGDESRAATLVPGQLTASYLPTARLFARTEGRVADGAKGGFGYAICRWCGFTVPEDSWAPKPPAMYLKHERLRGRGKCEHPERVWRHAILGTSLRVDALRFRLWGTLAPQLVGVEAEAFALTLAALLAQGAARRLGIDPRILRPLIGTYRLDDGAPSSRPVPARDAILVEEATSGILGTLLPDALSLVREMVTVTEDGDDERFIRFDTQFLASAGMLRPDLIRRHFADRTRRDALGLR